MTTRYEIIDTLRDIRDNVSPSIADDVNDLINAIECSPALTNNATSASVYDHYERRIGVAPDDETLRELPCNSTCGASCVDAIDSAVALIANIRMAHGDTSRAADMRQHVINVTFDVIETFWRG